MLVCQWHTEGRREGAAPHLWRGRSRSAGPCRSRRWWRTRGGRRSGPQPCTPPATAAPAGTGKHTARQRNFPAAWRSLRRRNGNMNMKSNNLRYTREKSKVCGRTASQSAFHGPCPIIIKKLFHHFFRLQLLIYILEYCYSDVNISQTRSMITFPTKMLLLS